jgi:hypothetical protein
MLATNPKVSDIPLKGMGARVEEAVSSLTTKTEMIKYHHHMLALRFNPDKNQNEGNLHLIQETRISLNSIHCLFILD